MPVYDLPQEVAPWGPSGPIIPFPGNPAYVDGTDISDALFWLFTRTAFDGVTRTPGIGNGPYAALSGISASDLTVFRFPGGLTSWIEEGFQLGLFQADNRQREYSPGFNWPKYPAHAWRHIRIVSDDPDNRHILWQEDPENFNDGITSVRVTTTANSTTAVLTNALSVARAARIEGSRIQVDASGNGLSVYPVTGATANGSTQLILSIALGASAREFVQSVQSEDGTLYPGGQYGTQVVAINETDVTIGDKNYVPGRIITVADPASRATVSPPPWERLTFWNPDGSTFGGGAGTDVESIAVDRKTLTLAEPAYWDRSDVPATLYLSPIRPERNGGVPLFVVDGPGGWTYSDGTYDERGAWSYDIGIDDIIIRGSNADDESGIAGAREEWIAVVPRRVTGLVLDGTDIVFEGRGLEVGRNVTLEHVWSDGCYMGGAPEDVTFNAICNGLGRHWIVPQGCVGFRSDRSLCKNTERLGIDVETTSAGARVLDLQITNACLAPGTAVMHCSPATLNAEPARIVDGIGTTAGSKIITVPNELLQADDRGAFLDHPNLPEKTYLTRRMGPTVFVVSQAATATGTADGELGGAVLFRDFVVRNMALFSTTGNVPLDCAPPKAKVYFTYTVNAGSLNTMSDIQFMPRLDGQTFTTDDVGTAKVTVGQSGLFPWGSKAAISHTSTSLTFAGNSTKATGPDVVVTGTSIAGSRDVVIDRKLANADYKSHVITAPDGVFRDGTFIERLGDVLSNKVELTVPALLSGTFTMTISGRGHGYFAGDDSVRWTGFEFSELRPLKDRLWNGIGLIQAPSNQPCIMAPFRTDDVTISKNFLLGQRTNPGNQVTRYMAGAFAGAGPPLPIYGEPDGYSFTIEDNWGPTTSTTGMVDNQRSTPTTTVSLVMTVDLDTSQQPVFTVVCERSDAVSMDGYALVIVRDGTDVGPAIIEGDTATFRSEDFSEPLDPGDGPRWFQARWGNSYGGSWDTLGALSNTITIRPDDAIPDPTTTTLSASPASPQVQGVAITLTATVDPDPSSRPGTVEFFDDGVSLGTVTVTGPETVLVLPTGLGAGVHPLQAEFSGNSGFEPSTSNVVTYTTTAPTGGDVETSTELSVIPTSPVAVGTPFFLSAEVFGEGGAEGGNKGGTVSFYADDSLLGTEPLVDGGLHTTAVLEVSDGFDTPGTYDLTAEYSGSHSNGNQLPSTSDPVSYEITDPVDGDTDPPEVVSTTPHDGQESVAIDLSEIVFVTDETLRSFEQDGAFTFTVTADGVPVNVVWSNPNDDPAEDGSQTYEFLVLDRLPNKATVTCTITSMTDDAGNTAVPYVWTFKSGVRAGELIPQANLVARSS